MRREPPRTHVSTRSQHGEHAVRHTHRHIAEHSNQQMRNKRLRDLYKNTHKMMVCFRNAMVPSSTEGLCNACNNHSFCHDFLVPCKLFSYLAGNMIISLFCRDLHRING